MNIEHLILLAVFRLPARSTIITKMGNGFNLLLQFGNDCLLLVYPLIQLYDFIIINIWK